MTKESDENVNKELDELLDNESAEVEKPMVIEMLSELATFARTLGENRRADIKRALRHLEEAKKILTD